MKIVFNRQQVLAYTAPLLSTASNKSTMSAVEGILIDARHPDVCTMTTYDLDKGIRISFEAKVIEEGCYIINAQKFVQTMRVMAGEEVTLTVDQKLSAVMESGKSSHKMIALRGADFPDLPLLTSELGFTVTEGLLKKQFSKIMYAMGVNDQRPVLNGCFVAVEGNELLMVSCDSFKLAKCKVSTDIKNENEDGRELSFRFILPVKTVNELYKLISDDEEKPLRIHMMRKHIVFYIGDMIFFSRLVDGDYIDFDRIIIKNHRIFATLDRDLLLSALERAALVTEERVERSVRSHVKLHFEEGLLKIIAASTVGSTYDEIEIAHEGDDVLIAFNNRYLTDSVRACESDMIKISLSSPLTSVNIEPAEKEEGDGEDVFMLLPVRMKE